jgi:NTE family protein
MNWAFDNAGAPSRAVHIVLGAGGVRVISYIGALVELAGAGFEWRSIAACSAGTFVGALLATGLSPGEIERRALRTDLRRIAGPRSRLGGLGTLLRPFARYTESGAPALFREMVGGDPLFRDLKIAFATAGIDLLSNRLLVYSSDTHPDMPVAEALRIAVGIPPPTNRKVGSWWMQPLRLRFRCGSPPTTPTVCQSSRCARARASRPRCRGPCRPTSRA